jgi:UDP-2-acetamido-2-deoxy-ribo-hexuluronate aminotransferase
MNNINFRDLNRQYDKYKQDFDKAISDTILSSSFILGPSVQSLERELAEYVGVKHCLSCANGTDALSLVLMAWGITKGDAVFVPNYTFFSTAEVVSHIGATPIFVDVDLETFNMNSSSLREAIDKVLQDTTLIPKVIIPVDLFGLCANYRELNNIASEYSLKILEDAAQGFGASMDLKKACSFGDAATTSFYPAKPLGCWGDGGAIFTNDDTLAETIKSLRSHGIGEHRYDHVRIGLNSRLDTIQASILRVKLNALQKHELNDVNRIAEIYNRKLSDFVIVPVIPEGFYSSYAQYTIRTKSIEERSLLSEYLGNKNIPTVVYYPKTMHQQNVYKTDELQLVELSRSELLTRTALSLPMHPYLTDCEIDYIVDSIEEFYIKLRR